MPPGTRRALRLKFFKWICRYSCGAKRSDVIKLAVASYGYSYVSNGPLLGDTIVASPNCQTYQKNEVSFKDILRQVEVNWNGRSVGKLNNTAHTKHGGNLKRKSIREVQFTCQDIMCLFKTFLTKKRNEITAEVFTNTSRLCPTMYVRSQDCAQLNIVRREDGAQLWLCASMIVRNHDCA